MLNRQAARVFAGGALALCALGLCASVVSAAWAPPVWNSGVRPAKFLGEPRPRLSVDDFRCIVVGDSQTTDPSAERIRTQTHRWDAPIVGELVCVGASSSGFVVNNGSFGVAGLSYENIDMNDGWGDGGADDFFALFAAQWSCSADITATGARIGRYRLRFSGSNSTAPWDTAWGIGEPVVARIAVRTGPMCVDAVETRADRGGQSDFSGRTVHTLSKQPGVQVIEQFIPVDLSPGGDDVGVGLYLPSSSVEKPGQVLQVLGVLIERVGPKGERLNGTLVGYQGRGGWSLDEHINRISTASRMALIEMCDADRVVVMQGHNQENGGASNFAPSLDALVWLWEDAYEMLGRRRPGFVFVVPWAIFGTTASDYLLEVERAMRVKANRHRNDAMFSYLPLHDYTRPDLYDPASYTLDPARVHPGDIPTAINLAQDLYEMLFEGRRD